MPALAGRGSMTPPPLPAHLAPAGANTPEDRLDIHEPFAWCLHCERTYENSNPETDDFGYYCHYEDCDGGYMDRWVWGKILDIHPSYPKSPEPGKVYPLYLPD